VTNIPDVLTPEEVADKLRVSVRQVYHLVQIGDLESTRLSHKALRVYASSVAEYMDRGRTDAVS
jgi:excisionase family DNA binding protein